MKEVESPTLLLLRHGKTDFNTGGEDDRLKGTKFDIPINAEGRQEARRVATKLKDYPVADIKRSSMLRNKQSVAPVSEATGVKSSVAGGLDPWDIGYLSGHKRTEALDRIEYYIKHPYRSVPEGEPYQNFWDRFTEFLADEMMDAQKDGKLHVLSSHSCNILAAIAFVNGDDPKPHVGKMPPPGSITAIERRNGKWAIRHDFAS